MKVREFISKLQEQDQEAEVVFRGKTYYAGRPWVESGLYDEVDNIIREPGNLARSQVVVLVSGECYP